MYKLLLAEHSDIVIKEIMDKLDDRWDVRICSHGPSVSDMLDEFAPDVLVIYANRSIFFLSDSPTCRI